MPGGHKRRLIDAHDERYYDARYRKAINEMGGMARKCEHRIEKGWPDNYAPPGIWWECKRIRWYSTRPISIWSHFEKQQIVMLRDLALRGADSYVVIFWEMGWRGEFVQTINFLAGRQHERFDHSLVIPFADKIEDLTSHVRSHWRVERKGAEVRLLPSARSKTELDRSAHPFG